ncbi:hypothetical protein Pan14r_18590 [Crateriforma conspicua]|uniref:Cytochrome c-552/4 domain-containing protein n=2 Tax=Crateriforma conspicua TaxID=2527996 RepID=A0A5C5Y4K4_9PLAN|nr:hypothetical protein Pan14r_18590 [Crateriforma conspicua]
MIRRRHRCADRSSPTANTEVQMPPQRRIDIRQDAAPNKRKLRNGLAARMTGPWPLACVMAIACVAAIGASWGRADDESLLLADPADTATSANDDPLLNMARPKETGKDPAKKKADNQSDSQAEDPHLQLWTENCYPSAETCRKCHPKQYDEWSISSHAYAAVSPMFQRFEQAMTELTQGTVGSFCVRCHSPVQTQLELPRDLSLLEAPAVVREGITCIACHRVNEHYGRSHGDRRIEPGNIHAPVNGGHGGHGLRDALAQANKLKLKTSPDQKGPGQPIHASANFFSPITNSDVCVSCHQVAVHPGLWLEIVHAQYRSGPAEAKGISCQDCHMGAVPGKPLGYEQGHAAVLNDKPFGTPRKHSNHTFWGPGYSIAHPGIFPHHPKARKIAPRDWLAFDVNAGWGTKAFEDRVDDSVVFPEPWSTVDDRIDGRKIIDENIARVHEKRSSSAITLESAIKVSDPIFYHPPRSGRPLHVGFRIDNVSEGHNAPTGSLGAQPQLWLNAVLIDPKGRRVWETGYLDRQGDLADLHSVDVARGHIPRDAELFNLQTKFLINNIRGTDREVSLPLNFSLDQLVFLRPGAVPVSVLNHPPLIRMEAHSIPPLDHRIANYTIPPTAMKLPGPYRLSVRMRSRTEPIYFMKLIGASPDMIRRMNANMIDINQRSHTFWVR